MKFLTRLLDPERKFCYRCGKALEYAHDEQHRMGYDLDTGKAIIQPYTIRGKDLQYCIKDNLYIQKDKKGEWHKGYDLMEILHLIA